MYVFIYLLLFNNAFSSSNYTKSNDKMFNEFERIRNEPVMAYFKVLSWHLPEGTEEIHEKLSQDSRSPG
jgi:hypothetical protein